LLSPSALSDSRGKRCWYLVKADSLHVFDIGRAERRYTAVAEFVDRRLPANAVIVTLTQAGSIRFYGHRPTVRWDLVDPRRFDETLESLRSNG
jgi:hypothetical protein